MHEVLHLSVHAAVKAAVQGGLGNCSFTNESGLQHSAYTINAFSFTAMNHSVMQEECLSV